MANQDPKAFPRGGRDASESADDMWRRKLDELRQEGYNQRTAADKDWRRQLDRNARQDREKLGDPKSGDCTPWLKSNAERTK